MRRVVFVVVGIAVALAALAAFGWWFLAPDEHFVAVSWDAFEGDVEHGTVDEVRIDATTYTYRDRAAPGAKKRAVGPEPTFAILASLRPSDKDRLPPKIFFEGGDGRVAFSEFLAEVHAGLVARVRVHGREFLYEIRGADPTKKSATKDATGPRATKAEIEAALRPDDPRTPPPTLAFD